MKPKRLSFPKLDRKGIPLEELIAVHEQFSVPPALRENLGDGFLYATNPIFANVRREVLRCGFRFSLEDPFHYYAFPLMCLDTVLEQKVIPYRDNFYWLKELHRRALKLFTLTELKRSELQFNYLFHESAHCIAHSHLFGNQTLEAVPKNRETLLKILIGEAFANTVEALSALFIEGEMGNYWLDANCHFRTSAKEVRLLTRAANKIGLAKMTQVLFGSFLYSNFMLERLEPLELGRLRRFASLGIGEDILPVVKVGLSLSTQFRTTTTQLHLLKIGFSEKLPADLKLDPIGQLLRTENKKLRQQVDKLLDMLLVGVYSR